ncbi:hypothetical protein [Streptomyces sp. NPDC049555]
MGPTQSPQAVLPPVVRHVYITVVSFSSGLEQRAANAARRR